MVLIAPDKFAGALTARQAAVAMADGLAQAGCPLERVLCPIADGGEGTFDVLPLQRVSTRTVADPLGRPVAGRAGWLGDRVVVESADACGIRHVRDERQPWASSTFGVGQLLAASTGPRAVGLGGSATIDLGCGMAAALGMVFLDGQGRRLEPTPQGLLGLARVEEVPRLDGVVAWCDVDAPLWGAPVDGTSFLAQKGVDDVDAVVAWWRRVVDVLGTAGLDVDVHRPGTGAAGGLGLMLHALGASLVRGSGAVLEAVGFDQHLPGAEWVLTGEGRFDRQSLAGKGPGSVVRRARERGVPAVVLAGSVGPGLESESVIAASDPSLPLGQQLALSASSLRRATSAWWSRVG